MNAQQRISRRAVLKTGALVVAFAVHARVSGAQGTLAARIPDTKEVDGFLELHPDGTVTVFCGKVDLGTGLRIAIRQMVAEELGTGVERIELIEGDTDLTPDQGPTAGSTGIMQGGVQIRQAAATARKALIELAARRLGLSPDDLVAADGRIRPHGGGTGPTFADLIGDGRFQLRVDPKAPLKDPDTYRIVGKPLPRPDVPAKVTGTHVYVHDFVLPEMLHGRVVRPPAIGANLVAVDETSVASLPDVRVVRIKDFLGVVAADEWTAVRAARDLKAQWSEWAGLPEQHRLAEFLRAGPFAHDETLVSKGEGGAIGLPPGAKTLQATYFWPNQSHGSIGPSCAVADVRADRATTIYTASQATHRFRPAFAQFLGLPVEKVRLVYLDGSGCYGMNGHEDAAADAALLSRAVGRPVRVQWMREDEHGFDPKGPPQLIDLSASVDAEGRILDWLTELWIPEATKGLPAIPLLAPAAAGLGQARGLAAGLISQNADPPYAAARSKVVVHWLKDTPLRPAQIRSPGKIANTFAVEAFIDELAAASGQDPLQLPLRGLGEPRGIDVLTRVAAMLDWQTRPSPGPGSKAAIARGRGLAYVQRRRDLVHGFRPRLSGPARSCDRESDRMALSRRTEVRAIRHGRCSCRTQFRRWHSRP